MTIVLLEDERDLCELYVKHFSKLNLNLICFESASELLSQQSSLLDVQVFLLDESIRGDDKKGSDCIAPLKKRFPDSRIIMLTNFSDSDLHKNFLSLGADDVLLKIHVHPKRLAQTLLKGAQN